MSHHSLISIPSLHASTHSGNSPWPAVLIPLQKLLPYCSIDAPIASLGILSSTVALHFLSTFFIHRIASSYARHHIIVLLYVFWKVFSCKIQVRISLTINVSSSSTFQFVTCTFLATVTSMYLGPLVAMYVRRPLASVIDYLIYVLFRLSTLGKLSSSIRLVISQCFRVRVSVAFQ